MLRDLESEKRSEPCSETKVHRQTNERERNGWSRKEKEKNHQRLSKSKDRGKKWGYDDGP